MSSDEFMESPDMVEVNSGDAFMTQTNTRLMVLEDMEISIGDLFTCDPGQDR